MKNPYLMWFRIAHHSLFKSDWNFRSLSLKPYRIILLKITFLPHLCIIYFKFQHELSGLAELKLGGVLYILGVFFFKADGSIPCAHAIWHLFVVLAAAVHYYAILNYLYPELTSSRGWVFFNTTYDRSDL